MNDKMLNVIAGTPDRPLRIGDIEIPCYVLEDETRVLSQRGMFASLDAARGSHSGGAEIPRVIAQKSLSSFVSNELTVALKSPVLFQPPSGGKPAYGYPATILVDICNVYLAAREAGALLPSQQRVATRAEVLIRGLATVGIIALVDEATQYQRIREERALATILEKFIAKELQPWTKTFPYEFYEQMFRLKGWDGPVGHKRSPLIGKYTNSIVYERLPDGVLDALRQKNPILPTGRRKAKHHQWFTPEIGHPKLKEHLAVVIAFMRASPNWTVFIRNLNRAFPTLNTTREMPLEDG